MTTNNTHSEMLAKINGQIDNSYKWMNAYDKNIFVLRRESDSVLLAKVIFGEYDSSMATLLPYNVEFNTEVREPMIPFSAKMHITTSKPKGLIEVTQYLQQLGYNILLNGDDENNDES